MLVFGKNQSKKLLTTAEEAKPVVVDLLEFIIDELLPTPLLQSFILKVHSSRQVRENTVIVEIGPHVGKNLPNEVLLESKQGDGC